MVRDPGFERKHPRNPKTGEFAESRGAGWAQRISDWIGRRRGEEPPAPAGPDLSDARRRYGLPDDATPEAVGEAIRRAATGGYERDREGVYRPPGHRLDEELADLTRQHDARQITELKKKVIDTYTDDMSELVEDINNEIFQHDYDTDPELERLSDELFGRVWDQTENWSARLHSLDQIRRHILKERYRTEDQMPRRPSDSFWRRD